MLLPCGDKLLEAFISDLSLMKPLGVTGVLMQGIDGAVPLFGDLFPGLLKCLRHLD